VELDDAGPEQDPDPAHDTAIEDFRILLAVDAIIHAVCEH